MVRLLFGYEAVPEGLLPALCQWLKARHGWDVDESHVLRSPNVLNALAVAASSFTRDGDGIIVQPPVFFDFFDIIEENRRSVISNPLMLEDGRYRMDFDDLEQKASDPRTTMIYLCNPHNPVGRAWTREELRTLGDICARHGVLVVADEMHGDLVFSGRRYTPFASLGPDCAANCITCLSPAKSFNIASCCSAFTLIADDRRRKAFQIENSRLTLNKNNAFASVAMEAAYRHGGPWLDAVLAYLEGNVELVRNRLNDIPAVELIEPDGTFLVVVGLQETGPSARRSHSLPPGQGQMGGHPRGSVWQGGSRIRPAQHRMYARQARCGTHPAENRRRQPIDMSSAGSTKSCREVHEHYLAGLVAGDSSSRSIRPLEVALA